MAKLSGVKIVDMTAGEVTKVAYEGAEYERAEHPIKKDDLILNVDDHEIDLTIGAFYKVISVDNFNEVQFLDDEDDGRDRHEDDIDFVPFRKVSAQDPTLEARVGKLESDVATLKGEQGPTLKFKAGDKVRGKPNGEKLTLKERMPQYDGIHGLAWNTEEYSSDKWVGENQVELIEEKPLAVGDYAKVVPHNNDIGFGGSPGDIVIIRDKRVDRYRTKELSGGNYHGNPWVKTEGLVRATDEEVAEAKAAHFEVGDYAKVVGRTYLGDIKTGAVVKITEDADEDGDYEIELLDGSDHDYAQVTSLEKVDADKAAIIDKWAKIGRGVNEYKEGDIVTLPGPFVLCSAGEVDSVGEVLVVRRFDGGFDTMHASKATLIAPVESRVDRN
ncbi:hypothetical protein [Shouchella rhizosphaerae]|uniref:Uncharacterized protein n=1 Tax=Shouchella rhizosphaerae TaxID=866786 RepID=A0ABZ2CZ86_9BACI